MSVPLPREILLWEQRTDKLYACEVRWRKDDMVGVHFVDVRHRATRRALLERCFAPVTCSYESRPRFTADSPLCEGPSLHDA